MSNPFRTVIAVDWSAAATPSPRGPAPATPWVACRQADRPARIVGPAGVEAPTNHRTRASVMAVVTGLLDHVEGPVLIGWDFGFGYPRGFADAVGAGGWEGVWSMLADRITDTDDNRNNRLHVAAELNDRFEGPGPFWGNVQRAVPDPPLDRLPARQVGISHESQALPFAQRRLTELVLPSSQPQFKMTYTGSVGSQSMVGIAHLQRLRRHLRDRVTVWPFQAIPASMTDRSVVIAEIYPTLFTPPGPHPRAGAASHIVDANHVLYAADALAQMTGADFDTAWMPPWVREEEGWILGAPRPT